MPAPRRPLNPLLRRSVRRSGKRTTSLAILAGFSHRPNLYLTLREEYVSATPRLVTRLERVADAVGFPKDDIFLDDRR